MIPNLINYIVGGKDSGKPLPIDVRLSLDAEFKKTIFKTAAIVATGIAIGTATGIVISEANKPTRRRR